VDVAEDPLRSAGDFLGLPPERRFREMSAAFDRVEADYCTIVIPPAFHEEAVMHAVHRKMPILSEKPIADTWEACVRIYRAVMGAGLPMQVVQNYRYTGRIRTIRKAVADGQIGRLLYAVGRFAADYRERNSWGKFRHEIPHSLLVEGSVHHFDQLRNLSEADCRTIAGWEWRPEQTSFDGECVGLYVMEMTNGSRAQYEGNCLAAGWQNSWYQEYYRLEGEEGSIIVDRDNVVRLQRHTAGQGLRIDELPLVREQWEAHTAIVDQFLTWMEGGPAPETRLEDNIKSAAMLFGAIDASQRGAAVDVTAKLAGLKG
jgi:predicted dehydrogenase